MTDVKFKDKLLTSTHKGEMQMWINSSVDAITEVSGEPWARAAFSSKRPRETFVRPTAAAQEGTVRGVLQYSHTGSADANTGSADAHTDSAEGHTDSAEAHTGSADAHTGSADAHTDSAEPNTSC